MFIGWLTRTLGYFFYGIRVEPFRDAKARPHLVLYNHQTPWDQFFIHDAFRIPIYLLATEDIFSNGWISSLIRFLIAPIPIVKQSSDISAIRTMRTVAKEGGTIAVAPEGNRTYSGKTEYINPSIAKLAKLLRLPVALFRIEGGYGVEPRWSDGRRKGPMRAYVSRVIEPEEVTRLSAEELYEEIRGGLFVNEAAADAEYRSEKRAEYLERAVYICPFCGPAAFRSRGNRIACSGCGAEIEYGTDKRLTGIGAEFPFTFVNDWYEYQEDYVRQMDLGRYREEPLFTDENVTVREVEPYRRKKTRARAAELRLFGDRIEIRADGNAEVHFFRDCEGAAVLGRNKWNLYGADGILQFRSGKSFNALKYVNILYHAKSSTQREGHGEFLGL